MRYSPICFLEPKLKSVTSNLLTEVTQPVLNLSYSSSVKLTCFSVPKSLPRLDTYHFFVSRGNIICAVSIDLKVSFTLSSTSFLR